MGSSPRTLWILSVVVFVVGTSQATIPFLRPHPLPLPLFPHPLITGGNELGNEPESGQAQQGSDPSEAPQGSAQFEAQKVQDENATSKSNGGGAAEVEAPTKSLGTWELFVNNSGVSAMHATLLPLVNKVQIYDATIWRISEIKLPENVPCHMYEPNKKLVDCWAHSINLDINTGDIRPLPLETDTWCSSGGISVNGTLISTGGFQAGAHATRYLRTCDDCSWVEYPTALSARRWYATQQMLPDGSFIVVGGRGAMSYEYIPLEGARNTKPYDFALLHETTDKDENNLYPFVFLNTDGNLFIFANNRSILLNPKTNKVLKEFPVLPGGARNYPGAASAALLPIRLHTANAPVIPADVVICGGARQDAYTLAGQKRLYPALQDCNRMTITSAKPIWKKEMMPTPRVMGDAVMLPTGDVLIINGARTGCSGWGFAKDPSFAPLLYKPHSRRGQRFKELAPSKIARVYHSVAIALPDGKVLVGGSNTHDGYKLTGVEFPTELRIEKYSPPYLDPALAKFRPKIVPTATPKQIRYGENFKVQIILEQENVDKKNVQVTMLVPTFTTHSMSMNMRLLMLGLYQVDANVKPGGYHNIQTIAPPNANVAPPGYYMLFAVHNGVPSVAEWIQIF